MINQYEESFFQENGYLIINDAYSLEDIDSFKRALYEVIWIYAKKFNLHIPIQDGAKLEDKCDAGLLALRKMNPSYALLVQSVIARLPEYYKLCSSDKVMGRMKSLLGLENFSPLYLTNNGIIFTNPNDAANRTFSNINTGWHRETFFTIPRSRFLHVWAPVLHHADEEIGTLMICQGSHKNGIGAQLIHPDAQYDHRYSVDPVEIDQYHQKSIAVKLGQALIFDGRLIHRSGINTSRHVRCTLIGLHHDISQQEFFPLSIDYRYSRQTPEGYYYELFHDEKAIPLISEQALNKD
jgi:hypothetical protein